MAEVRSASGFRCEVVPDRERVRIVPVGDLDLVTAPLMRKQIEELLSAGFRELVVDLHQTTFMDSTGLSALMECDKAARADGFTLSLVAVPTQVQRLLWVAGVAGRFALITDDAHSELPRDGRAAMDGKPGRAGRKDDVSPPRALGGVADGELDGCAVVSGDAGDGADQG